MKEAIKPISNQLSYVRVLQLPFL